MSDATWRVRAYVEYEIEASSEDEAVQRLTECILRDLEEEQADIRDIAEVNAEMISEHGIEEE